MCESQFNGSDRELLWLPVSDDTSSPPKTTGSQTFFFLFPAPLPPLQHNQVEVYLSSFDDLIDLNEFSSQG